MNLSQQIRTSTAFAELLAAIEAVRREGESLYIVGGVVRDLIMDRPWTDVDLVVEGDAIGFAQRLASHIGTECRIHEAFGTATVSAFDISVDAATARIETYEFPGVLPTVYTSTIDDDLRRRDFTINAVAVSLNESNFGEVLDPFGGVDDIANKSVKVLHGASFLDDPTRIFRAARYAARLGFTIDESTEALIQIASAVDALSSISGERIGTELQLIWQEASSQSLHLLNVWNALPPTFAYTERAATAVAAIDEYAEESGQTPAIWRMRAGAAMVDMQESSAQLLCQMMGYTREDTVSIVNSVVALNVEILDIESDAELLRRFPTTESAVTAGICTDNGELATRLQVVVERARALHMAISGNDLIAMGMEPGPVMGEVLATLYERRLNGEIESDDEELQVARTLVQQSVGVEQ